MDLNHLYERRQVSLFMAENASSEVARRTHREFAEQYAASIADARHSRAPLRVA